MKSPYPVHAFVSVIALWKYITITFDVYGLSVQKSWKLCLIVCILIVSVSKNGFVRNVNYFMESNISYSANTSNQSHDENNNNNSKECNNNNNDSTVINYNEKIATSANLQSPVSVTMSHSYFFLKQSVHSFPKS